MTDTIEEGLLMPRLRSTFILLVACGLLISSTGCIARFAAHMMNAGMGNMVPARCDALSEKRVAVVTVSGSSAFGPTSAADVVARSVELKLKENVKKIDLVDDQEIGDWMDRNDWNGIDFQEVGEAVGADVVVAIDLQSFSLYDGKTLFRGKCDATVSVYDIKNGGELIFEEAPPQIVFPIAAGLHTTDASERGFQRWFVDYVADRIARNFYPYDAAADFGSDATVLGG